MITYFLFVKFVRPLSISAEDIRNIESLWVSFSTVTDLLCEYQRRLKQNDYTLYESDKQWLKNTLRINVLKIKRNLTDGLEKIKDGNIRNLYSEFIHVCERFDNYFLFPSDLSTYCIVANEYYAFYQKFEKYIISQNLQRLFPTENLASKLTFLKEELGYVMK